MVQWDRRTCGTFAYGAAAVFDQAADAADGVAGHGPCGCDAGVQVAHGLVLDVVFHVGDHGAVKGGEVCLEWRGRVLFLAELADWGCCWQSCISSM